MFLFVTVGTTCFEALIRIVDTDSFLKEMHKQGYTELVIQIGRGIYEPVTNNDNEYGIIVRVYRYDKEYERDVEQADLIISHAGNIYHV